VRQSTAPSIVIISTIVIISINHHRHLLQQNYVRNGTCRNITIVIIIITIISSINIIIPVTLTRPQGTRPSSYVASPRPTILLQCLV